MNGHAPATPTQPADPAAQAQGMKAARAELDARVGPVLMVTIQGIMHTCPGIPPHEIVNSVCRVVGNTVGRQLAADLTTMISLRKGYKEAFEEGLKMAPIMSQAQPQAPKQG